MKAKEYEVFMMAVENAAAWAEDKIHEYLSMCKEFGQKPQSHSIQEIIEDEVSNSVCKWFDFSEDEDEFSVDIQEGAIKDLALKRLADRADPTLRDN